MPLRRHSMCACSCQGCLHFLVGKCSFPCRSSDSRSLWRTQLSLPVSFFFFSSSPSHSLALFHVVLVPPTPTPAHRHRPCSPSLLLSLSCLLSLIITALCSLSLFITSKLSSQFTSDICYLSSRPFSIGIIYPRWLGWEDSTRGQSIALLRDSEFLFWRWND